MRRCLGVVLAAAAAVGAACSPSRAAEPLAMVVMDPLALPLSCPCVQGYAQRDYDQLAARLESALGAKVSVVYSDSLTSALSKDAALRPELVIGKRSVVEFDARRAAIELVAVAALTGKDGLTTQTGLVVVPAGDPAVAVGDLKGYRIIFGPRECDEKHAAAVALLKANGVAVAEPLETTDSCSDGATAILEAGRDQRGAAVISSYAQPLLEGCGTIKKGDLRVVGETRPVPFITAFVAAGAAPQRRQAIEDVLWKVGDDAALCAVLETRRGFVALESSAETAAAAPADGKKN